MIHFLLTFSLELGRVVDLKQFRDSAAAGQAYIDAERANAMNPDYEIVLVGADSLEALKTTHGHYFDGDGAALSSPYLISVE